MEFLDISLVGAKYRYAAKIEKKFKQKKQDFGSANQKQGKGTPKLPNKGPSQGEAAQDNPPNPQVKNNTTNPKMDMGKWCELHKSSTRNTSECRAKQSLVVELKASGLDGGSNSESKTKKVMRGESRLLMRTPTPMFLPQRSKRRNQKIQRRQSTSSIPRCG
jgi:hypothetical protein